MRKPALVITVALLGLLVAVGGYYYLHLSGSTTSDLDERWVGFDAQSEVTVDNSLWQEILTDYVVTETDTEIGMNLFDYAGLLDDGREPLDEYVSMLVDLDPQNLNRQEQKAYWINLYNARTVQLILDNYPLRSITTLGSNPVDFGPWNDHAVTVNGIDLSLNDIEHRIIRPLYEDYRIHFGVNCASIGCPDLAASAFSGDKLDQQLDEAASKYLNHPRGVRVEGDELFLSSLFEWYAVDFGQSLTEIMSTIAKHIDSDTAQAMTQISAAPTYEYDWSLNGYCFEEGECGE